MIKTVPPKDYIFNCKQQEVTLIKAFAGNGKPAVINVLLDDLRIVREREEINNEELPGSEVVIGNGSTLDIEATVMRPNELGGGGITDKEFVFTFELARQDGRSVKDEIKEIIDDEDDENENIDVVVFKIEIVLLNNA